MSWPHASWRRQKPWGRSRRERSSSDAPSAGHRRTCIASLSNLETDRVFSKRCRVRINPEEPTMTNAHVHLVDPTVSRWYHCVTRCIRRALLLGERQLDRTLWIENRLEELAEMRKSSPSRSAASRSWTTTFICWCGSSLAASRCRNWCMTCEIAHSLTVK
jgi:hypothetical protein